MKNTKIFKMPFASVYPYYIAKAEKKGRTKHEVDTIIFWLTGYNLAKEIRVIGFWIEFETFTKGKSIKKESKFYPLKKTHFSHGAPTILRESKDRIVKKAKDLYKKYGSDVYNKITQDEKQTYTTYLDIIDGLQNFSVYNYITGLQAEFSLLSDFEAENCEFNNLSITQTYLFSDYKKTPAHEPTGKLAAARLFPLIKTNFITNPTYNKNAETKTQINSIRIDYRFQPRLDVFLYFDKNNQAQNDIDKAVNLVKDLPVTTENKKDIIKILKEKPQQAGVFIDEENVNYIAGLGGAEDAIFKAVEKPLIYEIAATGLVKGLPHFTENETVYKTWDNIHWWGGYKKYHIPSAPGAFHAMHLHWRWGGAVKSVDYGKESQFIKSGVPSEVLKDERYKNLLGPLVHPDCWIQSIRFVVVKYNEQDNNTTTKNFNDKFSDKINSPTTSLNKINDGENVELWYSVELHKELILPAYKNSYTLPSSPTTMAPGKTITTDLPKKILSANLNGTVFIHGLFFAHEEEPKTGWLSKIGSTTEEYFPKRKEQIEKERKFKRDAKL
jgi:hypothetical protein